MPQSSSPPDPVRRRFLARFGLAGLASLSLPALAFSRTKAPRGSPSPGASPVDSTRPAGVPPDSATASPAAAKPPEISEDARALAEVLKRRYGQHLTPEQLEAVTKEVENRLQGGKTLRAAKLANRDEPDFTFHA